MEFRSHISESAFLVNESRARRVALSHDRYAHLWVSEETRRLWDDFSNEVYPFDEIELGARNRFFLERLESFVKANAGAFFVNFGAGFTSYPFLTTKECRSIEIDYEHVVTYKRDRVSEWQRQGLLPDRSVDFLSADLTNQMEREKLGETLGGKLTGRPSIFVMEGLTYYLDPAVLGALFEVSAEIQCKGSILTFDFWTPDVEVHPVFVRFTQFFEKRFGHRRRDYNLFDVAYVKSIPGYELVELTDIQELERVYSDTRVLSNYEEILPENYAVLRRS